MICCSRWSPQKWSLPKNPTYRNKTLLKMHYFQLFMWDVFSGARKYCASFTVERLFCEVDIGITWWIERVATWGRFIIQMLRRLCWDNNIADSRNFLHWILDVVELLRWISPEWIHRELQNKLSTKPQGKHWSSLKPIKLPLGTLHLLSGFQGWVLPWVPLLIDVAILYLCCFIYAYKSLLHFFWRIYPNPGISFAQLMLSTSIYIITSHQLHVSFSCSWDVLMQVFHWLIELANTLKTHQCFSFFKDWL